MGGKFKNFHEKENRLALIREMILECFNFLLVSNFRKRKKKKNTSVPENVEISRKNFRFRPALILFPLFGSPISGENCSKNRSHSQMLKRKGKKKKSSFRDDKKKMINSSTAQMLYFIFLLRRRNQEQIRGTLSSLNVRFQSK